MRTPARFSAVRACACAIAMALAAAAASSGAQRGAMPTIPPQDLARIWDAEHVSGPVSPLVDHAEVVRRLTAVAEADPGLFTLATLGESVEGRSIHHLKAGTGPNQVLLWSQMHGDESTATSAMFDIFEFLRRHRGEPMVRRLLTTQTLHFVPMLNPDGAERFQRRNAQGLDINRDALRLQTPEGRLLKALGDRVNASVGFNLHNQNWRTSVGTPPRPASISLLSVAFDEARTETPGRKLTKRVCAVIRDAIEPFASGQIGRYDDEFEVRAFGDNITLWGTPVVLIETGPWPSADPDPALVRLNFIAILSALDALATGQVEKADPRRYESLPMNESRMFYVLVSNATVINGAGVAPYTADIGITANRRVRTTNGRREVQLSLGIDDLGDLRANGGIRTIDASGWIAVPDPGYEEGTLVDLPDWRKKGEVTISTGQPARLALLRPADKGQYRVEVVIR